MTMQTSDTIAALADALAKAQASVEGATKGKVNPAFKSKYADLASVWEACREALTQNGLSVIQSPGELADGRMEMTTMLLHASGEWARGSLTIPLGKIDAQGYGSATTYARRFALAAFVGVAPEDDDGAAATKAAPAPRREPEPPPADRPSVETLCAQVDALKDDPACIQWAQDRNPILTVMPDEEYQKVLAHWKKHRLALSQRVAA